MREIVNAIRYLARSGDGWRTLPTDFPPWRTGSLWFRRYVWMMLFRTVHDIVLMMDRKRARPRARRSAGVADSRTVKPPAPGVRYDAAKKTAERQRHAVVDTDGRLPRVNLTPTDFAGAQLNLDAIRHRRPGSTHLFADGADDRTALKAACLAQRPCART